MSNDKFTTLSLEDISKAIANLEAEKIANKIKYDTLLENLISNELIDPDIYEELLTKRSFEVFRYFENIINSDVSNTDEYFIKLIEEKLGLKND
ncbi:hypothetical protein LG296_01755 [Ureibacillus chungkukjangi]|uniref:hypothetical protein n=1 Tax=Ureibacillus chungkukjangi TaxID=1202712 RepID=UPI003851733A